MISLFNSGRWNFMPSARSEAIMQQAFDLGIDTFDTARVYASEGVVGKFIGRHPAGRGAFKIISKGGHPGLFFRTPLTREKLIRDLNASLKALGTPYIDIYLVHFDDPDIPIDELAIWSKELLRSGKILNIGYSNISLSRLKQVHSILSADGVTPWVSNEFNVFNIDKVRWQGAQNISHNLDYVEYLRKYDLPFLAYSPLGRGYLKKNPNAPPLPQLRHLAKTYGVSVPVIALSFVLQTSPRFCAVLGTSNLSHLAENVSAINLVLSEADYNSLVYRNPSWSGGPQFRA